MAIGMGSRGPEVQQHQRNLIAAGFLPPGSDDGVWGPQTQAATDAHHAHVMERTAPERHFRESQAQQERHFATGQATSERQFQEQMAFNRTQAAEQAARDQRRFDEEKALAARGRLSERNIATAGLTAGQAAARAQHAAELAEMQPRGGEIEATRAFQEAGARREDALARAAMRNQVTGQGLGLSGIREGAEGRAIAALASRVGGINLEAQQQQDALSRAIAKNRANLAAQLAQSEAEKRAIQQNAW